MTTQGFHVRRKVATYTYIVFGFLLGFEYTAINISQLFYLKLTVQVEEPEVFYSLITTGMAIAAAGSGVLAGYYTDKTRDLKKALFFFATLSLTGNLLYTIHHSVWFLLIGRFLCGLSDAAHPAISGEFSRLYKDKELTKVLSMYQGFVSLGCVMGPAFSVLSKYVDIQLFDSWYWNQNNFIGIFLAILYVLYIIWVLLALPNFTTGVNAVWKEEAETMVQAIVPIYSQNGDKYEAKTTADPICKEKITAKSSILSDSQEMITIIEEEEEEEDVICTKNILVKQDSDSTIDDVRKSLISSSSRNDDLNFAVVLVVEKPIGRLFTKMFYNFDIFLLIVSTALGNYVDVNISLLTTMTVSKVFSWSLTRISTVSAICILVITCSLPFGEKLLKNDVFMYRVYLGFIAVPSVALALIIVENTVSIHNEVAQICLVTITVLLQTSSYICVVVCARKLLFKVVPLESASYYEGVRNSFSRIFAIVGYSTAAWIFPHTETMLPVIIVILIMFVVVLCVRKRSRNCKWYDL